MSQLKSCLTACWLVTLSQVAWLLCACEMDPVAATVRPEFARLAFVVERNETAPVNPSQPDGVPDTLQTGDLSPLAPTTDPASAASGSPAAGMPGPLVVSPTSVPLVATGSIGSSGRGGSSGGGTNLSAVPTLTGLWPEAPVINPIPVGTPTFSGRVFALDGGGGVLPDAVVRTSDGRVAITGADGVFILPGAVPTDGIFVASCTGYIASAVVGLPGGSAIELHLRSVAAAVDPAAAEEIRFTVTGRLVDNQGQGVAGVDVVLEDGHGANSVPVESGPDGGFQLTVFAPGGHVVGGTLLAVGNSENPWIGMVSGLELTPQAALIPTILLTAATHPLRLQVDASQVAGMHLNKSIELLAPSGAGLALYDAAGTFRVAALPGARYALHVDAADEATDTASTLFQDNLAIDFATPETVVTGALLAPPAVVAPGSLQPGGLLSWGAVAGASSYRVSLTWFDGLGEFWEGFATNPAVTFASPYALKPGNYGLSVMAVDDPSVSPRTISAISSGAARLRVLPVGGTYRRSSRQLRFVHSG